jgi:hypothetical protein
MKLFIKRNIPNARARQRRALIIDAVITWSAIAGALWFLITR